MRGKELVEDIYPLSPMQEGMLFHSLQSPESDVYFRQISYTVEGSLDLEAFRRAWERLLQRHSVLRTAFVWKRVERMLQVVLREVPLPLEYEDCRHLSTGAVQQRLEEYLREDRERGFNLSKAPLMRVALFHESAGTFHFVWSHHHALIDGWSTALLLKELAAYYRAFSSGQDLHLEDARPYRDYIDWYQQKDSSEAESFWRGVLAGFTAPTPLPFSTGTRSDIYSRHLVEYGTQLGKPTFARLQSVARKHQLTINTLVQGAWAKLLSCHSGECDVVFGATVSGRPAEMLGVEGMVGMLINTLPVRVQVRPDDQIIAWLRGLQLQQAEAQEHQYTSLVNIRGWSDVPRGLPLFESNVVFENYPVNAFEQVYRSQISEPSGNKEQLRIGGFRALDNGNFPLGLKASAGEDLTLTMLYDEKRFSTAAIDRLLDHLKSLLKSLAERPDMTVGELSLMSEAERQQLLLDWNDTSRHYEGPLSLSDLFHLQVDLSPHSIAVVCGDLHLSYRELDSRCNSLARYLVGLGVGPDIVVAVCLPRGPLMVTALLAVAQAGAAYLPLDPSYPPDRLALLLEDSRAALVLSESEMADRLPSTFAQVICMDEQWEELGTHGERWLSSEAGDENLAYVIYTSGSTGQPKGVMISRAGLANYLRWAKEAYVRQQALESVLHTSMSFDLTVTSLWVPLIAGARVRVAADGEQMKEVEEALSGRQAAQLVKLTPSHLQMAAAVGDGVGAAAADSVVVVGGEQLMHRDVRWLKAGGAGVRVINEYGPTETVVGCCVYEVSERWMKEVEEAGADRATPIGRPIANTQVYVVDERQQPVPVGVAGELLIAGAGLARGYLNRPDLTAERFIPDSLSGTPGARVYRSGDKVRWLAEAELEYIGRLDEQVKISGFRIEPAEIEAVICEHAGVAQCAVVAREDQAGDRRLVAYVVAEDEAGSVDTSALREALHSRLPEYMLPSAIVMMESLPLTPNGKLDRKALPAPDVTHKAEESTAPRTAVEEILSGIWCDVLRVDAVGVEDNFFEQGGHSLLATQVISRIRSLFQVELPLRAVFESPTVAELAKRVEQARFSRGKAQAPALVPRSREGELALSYAQQRLWFLDQLEPGSSAYNIPMAVRLEGVLNVAALKSSISEIVRRHEVLRTRFVAVEGRPQQQIDEPSAVRVPVIDLSEIEQREQAATELVKQEASRVFDLSRGPLMRVMLMRLGEQEHVLMVNMHHIVSDGWSVGILIREFRLLYEAYSEGKPSPLEDLQVQYADFALWQREWLSGDVLDEQLDYWRKQLGGVSVLELPTDRQRPAVATHRGGGVGLRLSSELSQQLRQVSKQEGVTLFMLLMAALQALLSRYSGQSDIAVGTPIANRNRAEIEPLIGFFVNTLVMRSQVNSRHSFRELLAEVREVTLEAYEHQDVPFEKLVDELAPERDINRSPLYQVVFALHNVPRAELALPNLSLVQLPSVEAPIKVDLEVAVFESAAGLGGRATYATELFEEATIERLLTNWSVLLEAAAANPNQQIAEIALMTEAERHQLLVDWNATARPYPSQMCVHHLFQQQAEQTPDAVAVVYEGHHLSYRELERRANQVASYLSGLGVGPEVKVALCMDRSLEIVVGVLGVLKAGAVYVPMDASYPAERLAYMIDDSQAVVMLTQENLLSSLPSTWAQTICLDADWHLIERSNIEPVPVTLDPINLAYIMYTSGSTGQPKGICVTHRGIVRLVKNNYFIDVSPHDVFLQFAPISFDASTFELWASLLNGCRLAVAPSSRLSLSGLADLLSMHSVSTLWLTAGLFHQMVDDELGSLSEVRQLVAGGDVLSGRHVNKVISELAGCRMINGYGPTENTTFTCCHTVIERVAEGSSPSIGRPIANTQVYVVDERQQPVPVGVAGELLIGGAGLARGYLGRPDLTAERFIPDSLSGESGARVYRSGDKVRWLAEAELEYIGRLDEQVKVRGYRIEPAEIEAVLMQHASVSQCVVVVREDQAGDRRLVAYVVQYGEGNASGAELRQYLSGKLPEYMLPSAIVMMESLPLTPNGKVDKRALPAPQMERPQGESRPKTAVEEILSGIWCDVLRVDAVGVEDNFFEQGGHSLLATQVISRIRSLFQVELPLRAVFESPTVAELAKRVEQARFSRGKAQAPALVPRSREGELALSYAQQRLWFLDQLEPGSTAYNIPMAVRLIGSLDVEALSSSISEIVRRHEVLRTRFVAVEGRPQQQVDEPRPIRVPVIDLSQIEQREQAANQLVQQEASRPFDLSKGPLMRVMLMRLDEQEHVLMVNMHHIVSDGWSVGILIREFRLLYEAYSEGKPSPLDELQVQYADFALWQREWLSGDVLEEQLNYWKRQLAGIEPLQMPTDRQRPAVATHRGGGVGLRLSSELSQQLRELSRQEGVTLFMLLMAALQALLSRYSGQSDIAVGTPIANRNRAEIEPLIGFFVNTLVMRSQINSRHSFRELLAEVREVTLEAYEHQDVPFEKLVDELAPERDMSRSPLFDVMLVVQNASREEASLGGLQMQLLQSDSRLAKFDLLLFVEDSGHALSSGISYSKDLYDEASVARLLSSWKVLLESAAAEPWLPVGDMAVMTSEEREQVLVEWNDTCAEYDRGVCVHELVERQCRMSPDAVAVVYEGQHLSYGELDRRSNQLAHYLRGRGVGPEVRVGVCVERSLEMVVGLLGVLKAGGAYVPMDPLYPDERLAYLVRDSEAALVLSQRGISERLEGTLESVVCLDAHWGQIAEQSDSTMSTEAGPDNLAYLIYTSGSTGRPNGVLINHRNVVRLLLNDRMRFSFSHTDVWTLFHSFSFDFSVWEMFGALFYGGTLIVVPDELRKDPQMFADLLVQEGVTVLCQTPSYFYPFSDLLVSRGYQPVSLRYIIFGAEALKLALLKQFHQSYPWVKLVNMYGITETTVHVTYQEVSREQMQGAASKVGRPIATTSVYLLDEAQRPVPVGVAGEIYVGGDGLGRGYLNNPALTAQRFVPDGVSGGEGERLYRAGDIGRYDAEGCIEYLGRADHQVKVRGYRIEPAEIEAAICEHTGVAQCAVVAREDRAGDRRLVAYVVAEAEAAGVNTSALKEALHSRLPEYMLPSAIVMMESLPLTPNGKLDRKALPAPDNISLKPVAEIIYPRDSIETHVMQIWEDILHVRNLSIRDDFFRIGGNSLDAVALAARLRAAYDSEVPVRLIFFKPTIEEQAAYLRQEVALIPPTSVVPIQPRGSRRPLFCVHPAGGLIHCYVKLARALGEDQPVYGLQAKGFEESQTPVHEIEAMAANYIRDIQEVQPVGPYQLAGVSMGAIVIYEMAQQLTKAGESVSLLALLDPTPRLDALVIDLPGDEPPADGLDWIQHYIVRNAENQFGIHPDDMLQLAPNERIGKYLEAAKLSNLIPADVTVAQFHRLLHIMEINVQALKAYRAEPYSGRIKLFRTSPINGFDDTLGWGALAAGGIDLFAFPGQHGELIEEPLVRELADLLQRCMNNATGAGVSMPAVANQYPGGEESVGEVITLTSNQQIGD